MFRGRENKIISFSSISIMSVGASFAIHFPHSHTRLNVSSFPFLKLNTKRVREGDIERMKACNIRTSIACTHQCRSGGGGEGM